MKPYRILLADDHKIVRMAMKLLIEEIPGLHVVGEADDGQKALEMVDRLKPDLAILDISMPNLNGIEATREIRNRYPDVKILVLTVHRNRQQLLLAMSAGAHGYCVKEDSYEELCTAIERIRKDGTYVTSLLSSEVIQEYSSVVHGRSRQAANPLSIREQEVLKLITDGRSNRETAALLHISIRTVENHRSNIMRKLGMKNMAALVKYALRRGITEMPAAGQQL